MSERITCSWCSTINDSSQCWCKTCGHSAWLARLDCDCRECLGVLFGGEMTVIVPPPPELPAAHQVGSKHQPHQEDHQ